MRRPPSHPGAGRKAGCRAGALRAWLRATARVAVLAPVVLGACDLGGGPKGPVSVLGTITGSETLGGAVVELAWDGVLALEGRGDTRVYSAEVPGARERHRMVLLDPSSGELRFTIRLTDDRFYAPAVTIVSAVGTDNLPLPVDDLRLVLER